MKQHICLPSGTSFPQVAEVVPLKQGLKLFDLQTGNPSTSGVAEVVPLKQGLKHRNYFTKKISTCKVAEVVPLKQGLKHFKVTNIRTI